MLDSEAISSRCTPVEHASTKSVSDGFRCLEISGYERRVTLLVQEVFAAESPLKPVTGSALNAVAGLDRFAARTDGAISPKVGKTSWNQEAGIIDGMDV